MKIAVCVKHVPDGRVRVEPSTKRIDRSGSGDLNAFDNNAIEEALRIKDESDAEVVAIAMGPEEAEDSLRTALGLGADRAILVSDPAAAGSDLIATAKVLAKVIERETPDLVFFGQQTSDGGGALLWAAVAELVGFPVVSQVTQLELQGQAVRVTRQTEFADDTIEAELPAVVAVTDAINEPRYASLKGMMSAKRKPLEALSFADLGLQEALGGQAGSMTEVLDFGDPPQRGDSKKIEDEDNAAEAILEFLVERQLV
jgi:electron transfer flavoprotein beta subunit